MVVVLLPVVVVAAPEVMLVLSFALVAVMCFVLGVAAAFPNEQHPPVPPCVTTVFALVMVAMVVEGGDVDACCHVTAIVVVVVGVYTNHDNLFTKCSN